MTAENLVSFAALSFLIGLHAAFMFDSSPYKEERRLIVVTAVTSILIMLYAFIKV